MSGEEESGVQIKLLLIGGDGVGKSSFIDKINSLNCSKSHPTTNNENSPITSNTKEYNCNGFKIFIQGFIVEGPVEMKNENDFSSSDEDEEIREEYHIKFSPTKKSIIKFISSNNSNLPTENIFVFFYDLSDFNSIERLLLFYESINRKFKLNENQIKSFLIGNKNDKKIILNKSESEKLNEFIKLGNFNKNKYEISTKLSFNFNLFFDNFISQILKDYNYDSKKFTNILYHSQNFDKAERKGIFVKNDNPGPDQYNTNVYSFDTMEQRNEMLNDKSKKFNCKIFVNKISPIFSHDGMKEKKEDEKIKLKKNTMETNFQKAAEFVVNSGKGACMSGSKGDKNYNFLLERKKLNEKKNKEYLDSFGDNILSTLGMGFQKKVKDENYFKDCENRRYKLNEDLKKERKNQFNKYLSLNLEHKEKLNQDFLLKSQKLKEKFECDDLEKFKEKNKQHFLEVVYGGNADHMNNLNSKLKEIEKEKKKKLKKLSDNEKLYDIRGNLLNPNKGVTILGKPVYKEKDTNNADFHYIKTDFEKIAENKKDYSYGYSPRYYNEDNKYNLKRLEEEKKKEKKFDENKWEKFKYNRERNNERQRNINNFLNECHERFERHNQIMKEFKKNEDEIQKEIWKNYYKNPTDINYSQVETSSPKYSLKGRNEKKNIRTENNNSNMNYFSVNNNNNNGNNTDELPPLPNINVIRTRMPVFSFGTQERFNFDIYNKKKEVDDKNDDKNIESDIYFDIDKRKDFSKVQPMSSNLKREMFDMRAAASLPGPGLYNFPGFADEIIKKNQRYNNARLTKKDDNNKNKIETKTNTEVNNYMNEFNDNGNDINEDDIGELNKINDNKNVEKEQKNENINNKNENDEKNINNNTTTKNETE